MHRVLVIGTVETKAAELDALAEAISAQGLAPEILDISLRAEDVVLAGPDKLALMETRVAETSARALERAPGCLAALAIGGGTGGEMAFAVLRALPDALPKVLLSTMAFDPRAAVADTSVVLIPTLCDIEGVNPMLRGAFATAAAMVAGLAHHKGPARSPRPNVAVTTLGATGAAGAGVARALDAHGYDATVFHANGYGGAAFTRMVQAGGLAGVIDLNVHELGRLRLAGVSVPMPERFTAAGALPRIVLPGALNFLGLGTLDTLSEAHRARPHYRHSGHFTHVKLTTAEMEDQAKALAQALNAATGPTHVLLPMGGFSHEDRPGGAIEDANLRSIAATVLEAEARAYTTERLPTHINAPATATAAVDALLQRIPDA